MFTRAHLLSPQEYIDDALEHIGTARTSIHLLTMIVVDDTATHALINALCLAAKRGVPVTVTADLFTFAEIGGHFRFTTRNNERVKHITAMQHTLRASGVKFRWLGAMANSLVSGRTHSKWLVIDDTVYSFGGVNLYKMGVENVDYMLRITDSGLAAHLSTEQRRIIDADRRGQTYRSHKLSGEKNRVLIDGGFVGDSIIYRRACQLTEQASSVTYVSQYCATGKLGRLLKKTDSKLYFNPWNKATSLSAVVIRVGSWLSGHSTLYTRAGYLHAKVMIFSLPNGEKVALSGSHNFSHGGVWLGTREIALETRDPQIIRQLETFIRQKVA